MPYRAKFIILYKTKFIILYRAKFVISYKAKAIILYKTKSIKTLPYKAKIIKKMIIKISLNVKTKKIKKK